MSLDDIGVFVMEDCFPAVAVGDIVLDECFVVIGCWILDAISKLPGFDGPPQLPIRKSGRNDCRTSLMARSFESKSSSFRQRL